MKRLRLIPIVCLLSCAGCHRGAPVKTAEGDFALRQFLGVRSINASYTLPSRDTAYLLTLLEFENGKFKQRGLATFGTGEHLASLDLNPQVLWGTCDGKPGVAIFCSAVAAQSDDDFWTKLNGGWSSTSGDAGTRQQYEAFTILGYAESDVDQAGRTNTASGG